MSNNPRSEWPIHESAAFEELKSAITAEFGPNVDDCRIERFLKARDFDVKQAKLMLRRNLEWRRRNNADTILQDYEVPEFYEKYMGVKTIGFDKDGSPIIIINSGKTDHRGLAKTDGSEALRYLIYFFELIEKTAQEYSKEVGGKFAEQWTCIFDVGGLTLAEVSNKSVIERNIKIFSMYEANYPERLKVSYIINASVYFHIFLSILRPILASKTLQKVKVYGKNGWEEELLKVIDPEILPAYLGGKRTDPDGNPLCHTVVCHAGPVPEEFYPKSSEKRGLKHEQYVTAQVLKRRSKLDLPFEVQVEGSHIEWEIETDSYNIGFGLFYQDFTSTQDSKPKALIPMQMIDSHMTCETGTFNCEKPGIYILRLDNSASFIRSKHIYHRISVVKPNETKRDSLV